jgi:hypothetical protein
MHNMSVEDELAILMVLAAGLSDARFALALVERRAGRALDGLARRRGNSRSGRRRRPQIDDAKPSCA